MTMIEFISWIQREKDELENILCDCGMDSDEYLIKQGRLEEVDRIIRKLIRNGVY